MRRRILSLVLTLCLIVGLLPAVAVPHAHAETAEVQTQELLVWDWTMKASSDGMETCLTPRTSKGYPDVSRVGTAGAQTEAQKEGWVVRFAYDENNIPTLYLKDVVIDAQTAPKSFKATTDFIKFNSNTKKTPLNIVIMTDCVIKTGGNFINETNTDKTTDKFGDVTITSVGDAKLTAVLHKTFFKAKGGDDINLSANITAEVTHDQGDGTGYIWTYGDGNITIDGGNYLLTSTADRYDWSSAWQGAVSNVLAAQGTGNITINNANVIIKTGYSSSTKGATINTAGADAVLSVNNSAVNIWCIYVAGMYSKNLQLNNSDVRIAAKSHYAIHSESAVAMTGGSLEMQGQGGTGTSTFSNWSAFDLSGFDCYTLTRNGEEIVPSGSISGAISITPHKGEWVVTEEATCLTPGTQSLTCTVCGETVTRKYFAAHIEEETEVTRSCTEAGYIAGIKCASCDLVLRRPWRAALGHKYIEVAAVEPGCGTAGNVAHWGCSRCDAAFSATENEDGTITYTELTESVEIPATGNHTNFTATEEILVEATCTTAGSKKVTVHCADCGTFIGESTEEIPALGHTEEVIPGTPATSTATGLTDGLKCSVCGEILVEQEEIPMILTEHIYVNGSTAVAASTDGKCTYLFNAPQTLTDSNGNEFEGSLVVVDGYLTTTEPEGWNAKFEFPAGGTPTLYLKGLNMDHFNEDSGYYYSGTKTAFLSRSTAPVYDLKIVILEDSYIGVGSATYTDASKYQGDLYIESQNDATLTSESISGITVTNGDIVVDANLDFSMPKWTGDGGNKLLKTSNADNDIIINGGNIKMTSWKSEYTEGPWYQSGYGWNGPCYRIVQTTGANSDVIINGGTLEVKAMNGTAIKNGAAIEAVGTGGMIIVNGGDVTVTAKDVQALRSRTGILITGGNVKCSSGYYCLWANPTSTSEPGTKPLKMTGGTLELIDTTPKAYAAYSHTNLIDLSEYASWQGVWGVSADAATPFTEINATQDYIKIEPKAVVECEHTNTTTTELVTKDATCTEAGSKTITVTCECGEVISETVEEIAALGHTEEIIPGKAATCTETGLTEGKKCSVCDEILVAQEEIAALGHTEEIVAGKDATCTETGLTEGKKCTVCGETTVAQEEIAALGHTEEIIPGKAATCTATGLTEGKKCTVCGETLVAQETIDALGHTEEIVAGKAATCTETGLTEGKKCTVCGETLVAQEEIAALGHTEDEAVKENVVAADCDDAGSYDLVVYCSVCNAEISRETITVDAVGHTEEVIAGKAATCTETGLTEGKKCTVCGETLVAQETIDALGHTEEIVAGKAATCTEPGLTEGKKCTVCGEITVAQEEIVALGHTEAEAAVENFVDSTLNSKGSYDSVVYCSVCKAELKRETIIIDEKPGAVAEIDGYKYATLQEAVNVGGEVKLLDDVVLEETVTVAADKTVILNLNGKTIYAGWDDESAGKHIYAFTNNGELTITGNGVINARGIFNYGSLTLESGTINAIDCNGGYAVRNYEGAAFTMNGGTVATTYEDGDEPGSGSDATTIRVDAGATAVINGGVINNISNYTFAIDNHGTTTVKGGEITAIHTTVANYGTLTIEDGEFTNNGIEGKTQHVIWAAGGVTTIKGGTFDGKDNFNGFNVNTAEGAKVEIMGGTFLPVHSGSLYGEGTIEVSGGTFFDKIPEERCAEGFIPTANEDGTYGVKEGKFVAEVNGTKYETLQEAVNAGGEVTLLTDIVLDAPIVIESGKVVTLDLGEFDITYTSDVAGEAMITNKGTLTIIGKGEIVYTYTGEADTAYTKGNYTITNSSTLTIDDACTIKNATAKMSHASYAINNGNGGTVVINDGLVVNETNYAIRQFSAGSITVNGGEVRGTRAVWMQAAGSNAANAPVMSLTVNDGKLVGTGESATYKLAVYSYSYGDSMKNVSITVTGGEIEGDIALTGGKNKTDAETVTVTGGTVTDLYSYATDEVAEKTINISGGTFEVAIYEAYCAEGFIPTANEDGTYGVKEGKFVAEVNGTKYETLQEAVNVGGEVKLLDDVVLEETLVIEAGKTVVLDLNGKSISQVKACTGNYNMIYNKGNLTITGNGKISFTDIGAGDPKFGWGSYTIRNEGTLVVENGTIENLSAQNPDPASGKVVHMYCAIFQYSGSTTINGGKISTPTYRSVRLWKGEMTINGGEFEGQVWIQAVDSTAKMTITGGTFAPRGVDGSSVFVGNIDNSGKLHVVDLKVTGGTFTTKIGANDVASLNGPITGGTFTAAAMQYTNADLINSEYEFTQNADGSYGVELHIHTEKTTVETVDATCTTAGYTKTTVICETCGETISETVEEIAALGHTEEIIPGKAATCTETGLTEGKKCTVCGEVLTAQEVIPATGHEYDENGTDTDCNICGAARPTVIVDGNTVSVQLNGVEIVKTHTFYVEGKNVDINNWAELKATGTLKSFKTSEFVLADAGAYVLRVEYLDKDGVRQAVSYTAEIATSLVPASKPEFVVKDNIVSVKANGATNIKVYAFYVEGKEVADINYWEALKAADPNFKTYSKGVIPLTKVGKYVLRAEYLDANGVKNVESFEVNIASVPVSLTVLENSVTVNVDGATNVKVFAFYVEGKSVSNIYNWSELKTVDPNFKTYVKNSFTLPEAGKYVLRVQYTNAQGEIVAVSYMANTSVITPAVVKDGNKIKLTTNGLTVKKVHVYYVEGAEIADINDWQELMAEAVSFKTYIKTPFYLNESGDYVVRIEYVDVKGATRIVSQAITV